MVKNLEQITELLNSKTLPTYDSFVELLSAFSSLLEEEKTDYRVESKEGNPGSLLDFQDKDLPVIVIPDLHARPDFLLNILNYSIPGAFKKKYTIFEALEKNLVTVICVGDALHTEYNTKLRWTFAENELQAGTITGPCMVDEMAEGLTLLCAIMKLKLLYPQNFHFLKGNHENITNRTGLGDYSFRKYADEGHMVMQFIKTYYGEDVLFLMNCCEDVLPLIAVAKNCVISHAEPRKAYTKDELINARENDAVVEGLTWTDNMQAQQGSVQAIINALAPTENADDYVYLAGHRPVEENYKKWQNGKFIQIHNPKLQNIAVVFADKKFDPEQNIYNVKNEVKK